MFELLKVLELIRDLYRMPRDRTRFAHYLRLLQGPNGDEMELPIAGFNPMGKALALQKLEELLALDAEERAIPILAQANRTLIATEKRTIRVALNLIDDVEGAWSNFYATHYKNKFEPEGLLNRNFCTPVFWTSESVTTDIIDRRIKEQVYRTLYWLAHGTPATLRACVEQEVYVQRHGGAPTVQADAAVLARMKEYYEQHNDTTDYARLLNFFYGDEASRTLNYAEYGIPPNGGFAYAASLAGRR